jgi:hypothetical protein
MFLNQNQQALWLDNNKKKVTVLNELKFVEDPKDDNERIYKVVDNENKIYYIHKKDLQFC